MHRISPIAVLFSNPFKEVVVEILEPLLEVFQNALSSRKIPADKKTTNVFTLSRKGGI